MPRTKGSKNKHHKPKHHKEKKPRGRPKGSTKQYQKQSIKININNGGNAKEQHNKENMLPVPNAIVSQVLSNVPSEFPVNKPEVNPPLYDINSLVQPIVSSIAQSNNINIPKPQPQIQPQTQPIIITQPQAPIPKQPDSKTISEHIEEQQNKVPEPLPQNQPVEPDVNVKSDILGFKVKDKFDGLKMKKKTLPFSKVGEATLYGLGGGIASGLAGPSVLNNAISTAGAGIGYAIGSDTGAIIGGLIGSGVADRIHTSYPSNTLQPERTGPQTVPNITSNPRSNKTLANRLYNATFNDSNTDVRTQHKERIKKSKLLKDIDEKKSYGTFQKTDIEPATIEDKIVSEPKTTILSNIQQKAQQIYKNIVGQNKGAYSRVPSEDNEDFSTTLQKSKSDGKKYGTYSLLPTDEDEIQLVDKRRTRRTQAVDEIEAARLLDFAPSTPIQTLTQTQTRRRIFSPPMKEIIKQNLTKLSRKALEQEKEKREGPINDKIYLLNLKRANYNRILKLGNEAIKEDATTTIQGAIKRRNVQPIYQIGTENLKNYAASQIQGAIKGKLTRNKIIRGEKAQDNLEKLSSNIMKKSRANQRKEISSVIKQKTLERKTRQEGKELKQMEKEQAVKTLESTIKKKLTQQKELKTAILKHQKRVSKLDTNPPKTMSLTYSKGNQRVEVTPQIKEAEKQYLRKVVTQLQKYKIDGRPPSNPVFSDVASSRLSLAQTLPPQTPVPKKK